MHLTKTLASLRANGVPKVYAFSDGPKTPNEVSLVCEVRSLLRAVDWCEISIVERPFNLGLGVSVRSGVSQVLEHHEALLVVEDDLVFVDGTYHYLSAALNRYKGDARVMSVTGWTHPRITPADVSDRPYFDGRAECWVWGTWRRAWKGMDEDAKSLLRQCQKRGIDPYAYGADLVTMAETEHERNIWAVRFLYLHLLRGGLCLRPPHSMVEHIGFDTEATNALDGSVWANPPLQACPPIPVKWPDPVEHPCCQALARQAYPRRASSSFVGELTARARAVMPPIAKSVYRRLCKAVASPPPEPASASYTWLDHHASAYQLDGWLDRAVAAKQHAAFVPLLEAMHAGHPRQDFAALAEAIHRTGTHHPMIIEIGSGSGWNAEVIETLLRKEVRYVGTDYSVAMTTEGRKRYPSRRFVAANAAAMPFATGSCEIVLLGTSLMHIAEYEAAIAESRRLTRRWCIFHGVPVRSVGPTAELKKRAYGQWTIEIVYNERQLLSLFSQYGLHLVSALDAMGYDLEAVVGEKTSLKTYVCEISG